MGFQNPVADEVKQKIRNWVAMGFTSTKQIHKLVTCYSNGLIPKPNLNNRSFYPTMDDIRNHINIFLTEER